MALTPRTLFQRSALVVLGGLAATAAASTLHLSADVTVTDDRHEVVVSTATAQTVFLRESFDVRDGDLLDLNLGSADIVVESVRGTTAEVVIEGRGRDARAEFERREYQVFYEGGTLHVRTKPRRTRGWRSNRNASFTVTVGIPERFDASLDTGSGDIRLDRLAGDLRVDSGSSEIDLGEVRGGDIRIDTGSGDVTASRLDGASVVVDTGSGEVTVGLLSGRARINTGSGDVVVTTDAGDDLSVDTGSGEIDIAIPRSAGADIAMRGSDVSLDRAFDFSGSHRDRSARGTVGGGGPRIEADTGSGDISLRAR